ncbi:MAG TPA: hypothetical protein VIW03_02330 [Anaeromyxobacter sp.]
MTNTKLAVAALAAAALAAQAAFLHLAVAAPLASAVGELRESARAATFEESITVVASRPARAAKRS